ncbi:neutral/alkaline non-lysosomal ceramidase N-terminal domain-containing protein [bacterium]|nr:neutral/alkaline non-lysosomal ceramidase N-terminal domain-containing protein [candidate division CSSED10-310 bacterium]
MSIRNCLLSCVFVLLSVRIGLALELQGTDPDLLMDLLVNAGELPGADWVTTSAPVGVLEQRWVSTRELTRGAFAAGAAEADITPPLGCPLAGYFDGRFALETMPDVTDDPFGYATIYSPNQGAHDRLGAQALVLSDGASDICLVSADLVAIPGDVHEALAQRVSDLGIGVENLMVFATHTHSGPGAMTIEPLWQLVTADLYVAEMRDFLVDRLEAMVRQAYDAMRPAALGFGSALTDGLTYNRRDGADWDEVVRVLRVDDAGTGQPLAALVNFAIHGTCLGGHNMLCTGDAPGAIRRCLADHLGGEAVVLFANGIEGDVAPQRGGWSGMAETGELLAADIMELWPQIETVEDGTLAYGTILRALPEPYARPGLVVEWLPLDWTLPLTGLLFPEALFQTFIIADQPLVSFPGEPITPVGRIIQQEIQDLGMAEPMIFACADHHKSYVVTAEEYWNGGYESVGCFFGPEAGELFTNACLDSAVAALGGD